MVKDFSKGKGISHDFRKIPKGWLKHWVSDPLKESTERGFMWPGWQPSRLPTMPSSAFVG